MSRTRASDAGLRRARLPAVLAPVAAAVLAAAALAEPSEGGFDLQARVDAARPGDTIRVPSGVHRGPLVLNKPLTVTGEPGAIIDGGEHGDVVRIEAPDVTLQGLTIQNTGSSLYKENAGVTVLAARTVLRDNVLRDVLFGIYLKEASHSVIRGNRIGGKSLPIQRRGDGIRVWYSHEVRIEDNVVRDSRDVVIWFSKGVRLRGNRISHGRYGLHFMYSDSNVIEENDLRHNSVGAFLMYSKNLTLRRNVLAYNRGPSGYGIGLKDMDGVEARGNQMLGNRVGLYLDNSPSGLGIYDHIEGNVFAYNDIGVLLQPAVQGNLFWENTFLENLEQVAVPDAAEVRGNSFTVEGRGNYWSDYRGYDLDDDGIGDLVHRPQSLFENLVDRKPKLRLFLFSPVQQAIAMAAQTFPAMQPRPKFTDEAPLMKRGSVEVKPERTAWTGWMWLQAGGLLSGALAVLFGGRAGAARATGSRDVPPRGRRAGPSPSSEADREMIRVRDLTKRFGRTTAVDGFSFGVRAGEAVALWGRNGAGKTTVIRCVLGLLGCTGRIVVDGLDAVRDGKGVRRRVGYVPQELAFYDDLTTRAGLVLFARLKRVPLSRVDEVLAEVGLERQARKPVGALSGGMKQRLALAIAMLADPPVLILDEMTSNLDAGARYDFLSLLRTLKGNKTILFTSHRHDEVELLADRVLIMEAGRLDGECGPAELARQESPPTSLKLYLAEGLVERAMHCLTVSGFTARRNSAGIWVQVQPGNKIAPIRALQAQGIPVLDFDVGNDRDGIPPGTS